MIPEYKNKANAGIGLGLLLIVIAIVIGVSAIHRTGEVAGGSLLLVLIARIAGAVLFIWGCCMYAKAKGYSAALGLLSLLFLIGLIVLAVLPDKTKNSPGGFPMGGPGGPRPY